MNCLLQRNFRTAVKKEKNNLLTSETGYFEGNLEVIAQLWLNQNSFKITEAYLETHDLNSGCIRPVPELYDMEAYLETGWQLRQALDGKYDKRESELFAETVRGIIQAETFLFRERGYASPVEYSRYWDTMYAGSCRYYSNLDRVDCSWDKYDKREGYLFFRSKTYLLYSTGVGAYLVIGSLRDTFHEINVSLNVSGDIVQSVNGNTLRIPHAVCEESMTFLEKLTGINVRTITKKEIAVLLGEGDSCVHLIDIAYDSMNTLKDFLENSPPTAQG